MFEWSLISLYLLVRVALHLRCFDMLHCHVKHCRHYELNNNIHTHLHPLPLDLLAMISIGRHKYSVGVLFAMEREGMLVKFAQLFYKW
eukprot:c36074_g1_i1 orf=22-285(+)